MLAAPIRGVKPDLIENGVTGYLIDSFDPVFLGKQIEDICNNANKMKDVAAAAKKWAERYDIANVLNEAARVYGL